jgi:RHS repeat-associated protein
MEKNQSHFIRGIDSPYLMAIAKKFGCKRYKNEINQFETEVDSDDSISIRAADPAPVFYYHPDHLGTSTVISNSTGGLHQYFFNLPFGETMIEGCTNSTYQLNYKFNAKELDAESGMYYYGARYYDPRISVWMSVDPMWEKYRSFSPFAYCGSNPINRIDPDGRDDYEINRKGKVVNRIENTERDAFFMVDKKGNRIEGKELTFDYGIVENFQSQYSDKAKTTFDWYNVRGDDNGKQLFEFFANNTTVEFSHLLLGQKGNNGLNIISTSHEKSTERSVNFLLESQYKFGYTIRGHNHNHPSNTPYPSGLDTRGSDIGFSNYLTNISLKNGSGVPIFKIYLPKTGKYFNYNRNSTYDNFPSVLPTPVTLPEIIVTPLR